MMTCVNIILMAVIALVIGGAVVAVKRTDYVNHDLDKSVKHFESEVNKYLRRSS